MVTLIVGLVVFFGVHLISANRELRDGLVAKFGEGSFKIAYSVVSLIGFAVMIYGYHKMQGYVGSKNPILWDPPSWTKYIAFSLMLPALVLLVASFVPSKIRAVVKHPMLAAVKFWALAHLFANGTVAALLLFSSFLAYAVFDRNSLKRRGVGPPETDRAAPMINDVIVVAVGVTLFALIVSAGHGNIIGKPLISW